MMLCASLGLLLATAFLEAQEGEASPKQQPKTMPKQGNLKAGMGAPDFTAMDLDGKKSVKLSSLHGKPVVLIFGSCT
jgi:hypothetical protein